MGWPVPDIPERKMLPEPVYRRWIILLISMLTVGTLFILSVWNSATYWDIFIYGVLPMLFLWLCLFGIALNKYEQSVAACISWESERQQVKQLWQHWSQKQLAIVGNVLFTPEEKGMSVLLGPQEEIPAYPKKARPLFSASRYSLSSIFHDIHQQLTQQFPDYRHYLHTIYVLQPEKWRGETVRQAIFHQWDLVPERTNTLNQIQSLYDERFDGLILVVCLQNWPENKPEDTSELVSAQLISSSSFVRQHQIPVIAGLGRVMPLEPEELEHNLDVLFEYNQLDNKQLQHVWVSGLDEGTIENLMQYAEQHQWSLPKKRPLHIIDHSFGPTGEFIFPVSLAMLSEAAKETEQNHLIIYQSAQYAQKKSLCLITRKLYLRT
ncbi:hypothetical protein R0378_000541 [Escherichia coli]|nr:hypothetical protein [Escherichia coli]EHS3750449.1 hypothetical protein [Escherichia coli]EHS4240138.1 hypothetical protein [Escherichia coli]EHS4249964.1 hypothetical protein [Escherichia coli]EJP4271426.1 hypothetical protein [Escherichia coli]